MPLWNLFICIANLDDLTFQSHVCDMIYLNTVSYRSKNIILYSRQVIMIPILWDVFHFSPLGYMGVKVLLMEHENDNLVSTEKEEDSIRSRQLGVQEFDL